MRNLSVAESVAIVSLTLLGCGSFLTREWLSVERERAKLHVRLIELAQARPVVQTAPDRRLEQAALPPAQATFAPAVAAPTRELGKKKPHRPRREPQAGAPLGACSTPGDPLCDDVL